MSSLKQKKTEVPEYPRSQELIPPVSSCYLNNGKVDNTPEQTPNYNLPLPVWRTKRQEIKPIYYASTEAQTLAY